VATGQCAPIPGQNSDEWYEHEFWSQDGRRVCFHGGAVSDESRGFCGWCSPDGVEYHKFEHATPGRAYAHYNLHPDGVTMVTDGEARPGCISKVNLNDGRQEFEVLCRHDSYRFGDDQRCHPHPSFTPDGSRVIFTSNRNGTSNVYMINWE
jgi:oligogalacturonide lyase